MYENPKKRRGKRGKKQRTPQYDESAIRARIMRARRDGMLAIAQSLMHPHPLKGLEARARAFYELRTLPDLRHLGFEPVPFENVGDAVVLGESLKLPGILDNSSQADEVAFLIRWAHYGYPVFRPTDDLLAGVLLSDPTNMRQRDLRLPFPAYVIELPEAYQGVFETSGPGRSAWPARLGGFGVLPTPTEAIRVGPDEYAAEVLSRLGWVDASITVGWARAGERPLSVQDIEVQMASGDVSGLENQGVYATLRKQRFDNPDGDMSRLFDHTVRPDASYWSEADNMTLDAIGRMGVGLALYIQTKQERLEPDVPARARARQKSRITRYTLGRSVKLPGGMVDEAKAYARGGGTKRRARWVVRGHWRNQAHGPGRSLRRMTWIEPYWAGRGEFAPRKYDVNPGV